MTTTDTEDAAPRVLLIGFTAEAADLSHSPLDVDQVRDAIAAGDAAVAAAGFDVTRSWIGDDHDAGVAAARARLERERFDVVLIGNGVRAHPRFTVLFEQLVNAVHELAPTSRFAFNADPGSTLDALHRTMGGPSRVDAEAPSEPGGVKGA